MGEGEESLLGMRFPADHGIAGWVLATRTPLVIEDVRKDPRFATDVAEGTGYVPSGLMAAPLLHEERIARRRSRCSTARSSRTSASRRWTCSGSSRIRPRSRSTCS